MKLRLNGNSIRLRLLRSDVATLLGSGLLEQSVQLGPGDGDVLVYGLQHRSGIEAVAVEHTASRITVTIPQAQAAAWAQSEQVGIYASVDLGRHGTLDVLIEKDFACLDLSDAENQDTFPNPQIGASC